MGKRSKKSKSVNWAVVTGVATSTLTNGASGSRMISILDLNALIASLTGESSMPIFNHFYVKMQNFAPTYPVRVECNVVIMENTGTFTNSDGLAVNTRENDYEIACNKQFSVFHIGNLDSLRFQYQPKNAADGVQTYFAEPQVFNLMPFVKKIQKAVEDPSGKLITPLVLVTLRSIGINGAVSYCPVITSYGYDIQTRRAIGF